MANPSLTPAPQAPAPAPLQPQTQQNLTQGKIITVPGIPGHFIQVRDSQPRIKLYCIPHLCQARDMVVIKTY